MKRKDPNNAGRVVWALGMFFFFSFIFLILIIVLLNLCRFKKGSNNEKGPKIVSFSPFFHIFYTN